LNDSYTGGSLEFPELGLTCRPTIGTAVIYPSGLNYKHKVTPVQSGERYVFIFRYNLK
jgi:predicted 2-oxoglutarate/Fe(II)-dependent dioxygenase YbiX